MQTLTSCCLYLIASLVQDGLTSLYCAASNGHDTIVSSLLEHNADPDIADKVGDSDITMKFKWVQRRESISVMYGIAIARVSSGHF